MIYVIRICEIVHLPVEFVISGPNDLDIESLYREFRPHHVRKSLWEVHKDWGIYAGIERLFIEHLIRNYECKLLEAVSVIINTTVG